MKYKVVDYVSDVQEVEFGTCELCFHTGYAEQGYLILEDENENRYKLYLYEWDWGDCDEIYISNVVDFSHWLNQQDEAEFKEIEHPFWWLRDLVERYREEKHDIQERD
ncbi:hypothetical protein O3794_02725 [Gemella sanguinis]|uniref:hypothetical protein n=1 Tax=Gemella sanguinis TaxID=84135 RepID=UPI00352BEDE8